MAVGVDLKDWGRKNLHYIAAWIGMGLVLFLLIIRELGLSTLVLIGPFIPYLIITIARMGQELKK